MLDCAPPLTSDPNHQPCNHVWTTIKSPQPVSPACDILQERALLPALMAAVEGDLHRNLERAPSTRESAAAMAEEKQQRTHAAAAAATEAVPAATADADPRPLHPVVAPQAAGLGVGVDRFALTPVDPPLSPPPVTAYDALLMSAQSLAALQPPAAVEEARAAADAERLAEVLHITEDLSSLLFEGAGGHQMPTAADAAPPASAPALIAAPLTMATPSKTHAVATAPSAAAAAPCAFAAAAAAKPTTPPPRLSPAGSAAPPAQAPAAPIPAPVRTARAAVLTGGVSPRAPRGVGFGLGGPPVRRAGPRGPGVDG
jgi:hypothetical protein